MKTLVTLEFANAVEAASALARLAGVIDPLDRPDAGAPCTAAAAPSPTAPAVPPLGQIPFGAPSTPASAPASAASAPAANAALTTPAGIEVDITGLPWDERIHSKSAEGEKLKAPDGTWKKRRGMNDPAFKARVEAELRAQVAGLPVTPPPAPVVSAAVPPAPAPIPAPPAPAPAPVAEQPIVTFPEVVAFVTPYLTGGKVDDAAVNTMLAAIGLTGGIAALAGSPQHIPAFVQAVRQHVAGAA